MFNFGAPTNAAANSTPPNTTTATSGAPAAFGFQQGAGDSNQNQPKSFFNLPSGGAQTSTVNTPVPSATSLSFGSAAVPAATTTANTDKTLQALQALQPLQTLQPLQQPGLQFGAQQLTKTTSGSTLSTTTSGVGGVSLFTQQVQSTAPTETAQIPTLASVTKTTDSINNNQNNKLTFSQIEEHINKWTLELEEQEKTFTNQATQINAWDNLLITNNDKIIALNDAVQKVKSDQQYLEQELDFIVTQQNELEDSILPMQQNFINLPQIDVERTQTYQLVENLDTQFKQMSEDLKEVIDYLNESTKYQDNTDPINQIGKILNAHMNSLQWIENSTSAITSKLDDLSKIHEQLKRDSERSFRATYNQLD